MQPLVDDIFIAVKGVLRGCARTRDKDTAKLLNCSQGNRRSYRIPLKMVEELREIFLLRVCSSHTKKKKKKKNKKKGVSLAKVHVEKHTHTHLRLCQKGDLQRHSHRGQAGSQRPWGIQVFVDRFSGRGGP